MSRAGCINWLKSSAKRALPYLNTFRRAIIQLLRTAFCPGFQWAASYAKGCRLFPSVSWSGSSYRELLRSSRGWAMTSQRPVDNEKWDSKLHNEKTLCSTCCDTHKLITRVMDLKREFEMFSQWLTVGSVCPSSTRRACMHVHSTLIETRGRCVAQGLLAATRHHISWFQLIICGSSSAKGFGFRHARGSDVRQIHAWVYTCSVRCTQPLNADRSSLNGKINHKPPLRYVSIPVTVE